MADTLYDICVIGAGPAGTQAAISAAHQMRHVLVLDAAQVSNSRGRAYWSKSVAFEDAPVLPAVTGPQLKKALDAWLAAHPVKPYRYGNEERRSGIDVRPGRVTDLQREGERFHITASTRPLKKDEPPALERFEVRAVVVASGFDDKWPDIEYNPDEERLLGKYKTVFRYAGNQKGWHVCIRCDGHLHVGGHLAILGCGDYIYEAALGAQDFTPHITILTNGRPAGMSPAVRAQADKRGIEIIETPITSHIGKGTQLLGLRFADGTERLFDGFLVDEGLTPNSDFLARFSLKRSAEGLLVVGEDSEVLFSDGSPVPGLYAAGDIVAGQRKLIATAFALGQDAGLSASDSLRLYTWPAEAAVARS